MNEWVDENLFCFYFTLDIHGSQSSLSEYHPDELRLIDGYGFLPVKELSDDACLVRIDIHQGMLQQANGRRMAVHQYNKLLIKQWDQFVDENTEVRICNANVFPEALNKEKVYKLVILDIALYISERDVFPNVKKLTCSTSYPPSMTPNVEIFTSYSFSDDNKYVWPTVKRACLSQSSFRKSTLDDICKAFPNAKLLELSNSPSDLWTFDWGVRYPSLVTLKAGDVTFVHPNQKLARDSALILLAIARFKKSQIRVANVGYCSALGDLFKSHIAQNVFAVQKTVPVHFQSNIVQGIVVFVVALLVTVIVMLCFKAAAL